MLEDFCPTISILGLGKVGWALGPDVQQAGRIKYIKVFIPGPIVTSGASVFFFVIPRGILRAVAQLGLFVLYLYLLGLLRSRDPFPLSSSFLQ